MELAALILFLYAVLTALRRLRPLADARDRAAVALALPLAMTGVMHFTSPEKFLVMMPPYVPAHAAMIALSGAFELLGAIGLLVPRTRRLAGAGVVLLLLAVFPANVHVAMNGLTVPGLPQAHWYYWARLPFQALFIAWVIWAARLVPHTRAELRASRC